MWFVHPTKQHLSNGSLVPNVVGARGKWGGFKKSPYTMKFYSATKKKGIQNFAEKEVKLKNITLSELAPGS